MILDSGFRRSVAGSQWRQATKAKLKDYGMIPIREECTESFRFGDGEVVPAKCSWTYPIGINQVNGLARAAEVDRECPPLMSMTVMESMKTVLDCEKGEVKMLESYARYRADIPSLVMKTSIE
jgi:hypothetical protein